LPILGERWRCRETHQDGNEKEKTHGATISLSS
jgi:hypothetical protein